MDYEKKYKEALERAKAGKPLDEVFPELKESNEERIRKAIENIIRVYGKTQGEWIAGYDMDTLVVHLRDAFAYLEKQKEQKTARWKSLRECKDIPDGHYVVGWFRFGDFRLGTMWNGLFVDTNGSRAEQPKEVFYIPNANEEFVYAEQKPTEWSEEDENIINGAVGALEAHGHEKLAKRLKPLRPQLKREDWTEEDSLAIKEIQNALQIYMINRGISEKQRKKLARWLDIHCNAYPLPAKLYPHWKPTTEHLSALSDVLEESKGNRLAVLKDLYNHIKEV